VGISSKPSPLRGRWVFPQSLPLTGAGGYFLKAFPFEGPVGISPKSSPLRGRWVFPQSLPLTGEGGPLAVDEVEKDKNCPCKLHLTSHFVTASPQGEALEEKP